MFTAHGVHDRALAAVATPPSSSLLLEAFAANLRLARRHYAFVSMSEAVAMLAGTAPWREHCVALTFDDSLRCHARLTAPLLNRLGIPATFYVSTATVESQQPYWWLRLEWATKRLRPESIQLEEIDGQRFRLFPGMSTAELRAVKSALKRVPAARCEAAVERMEAAAAPTASEAEAFHQFAAPLTWDEVRTLIRLGMTVGSHTCTHPHLAALPPEAQARELAVSKGTIEEQCGIACVHFSYPYGAYSLDTAAAARAAGYHSAVTTGQPGWNRPGSDLYQLMRFALPREPGKLAYLLCGWEGRMQSWRHGLARSRREGTPESWL